MQNTVWDEHELVRRCKEGSEAAYAELVHQHGARLVSLAYRLTGSRETAEDVVQETFLAAFRAMERFEPRPALAPWLTTIAVRLASKVATRSVHPASLDRLMGSDTTDDVPGLQLASNALDPHAAAEAAEIRAEVQRALDGLPFRQRTAVVLRLVVGMDYADAAHAMDVPLNTFKSLLLRGTRQLREALAPRLAEPPIVEAGAAALDWTGSDRLAIDSTAPDRPRPADEATRPQAARPAPAPRPIGVFSAAGTAALPGAAMPIDGPPQAALEMESPSVVPAPPAPSAGVGSGANGVPLALPGSSSSGGNGTGVHPAVVLAHDADTSDVAISAE